MTATNGYLTSEVSLALNATGGPSVTYHEQIMTLGYAYWNGSCWVQTTVDNGNVGHCSSLKFDALGRPHIAYSDYRNSSLKYAWWNGVSWALETVDSTGDCWRDPSLELDAFGRPHIAYFRQDHHDVGYARWNGTAWVKEIVDRGTYPDDNVGADVTLELDSGGYAHMCYYDATNENIRYATNKPVSEPSGLLALACGVSAVAGMAWRGRRQD